MTILDRLLVRRRSADPKLMPSLPAFPPHASKADITFGTARCLPDFHCLPQHYQDLSAPGCLMADVIFYEGWESAGLLAVSLYGTVQMAAPPRDYTYEVGEITDPVLRFQRSVQAHLQLFSVPINHRIARAGYLIDLWLGVLPHGVSEP